MSLLLTARAQERVNSTKLSYGPCCLPTSRKSLLNRDIKITKVGVLGQQFRMLIQPALWRVLHMVKVIRNEDCAIHGANSSCLVPTLYE